MLPSAVRTFVGEIAPGELDRARIDELMDSIRGVD
jgi:hypothetical protein